MHWQPAISSTSAGLFTDLSNRLPLLKLNEGSSRGAREGCWGCERRALSVSPENCDYSLRREDEKCVRVLGQVRNAEIPQHFQNSLSLKAQALKDDLMLRCSQAERQNSMKCCIQKHCIKIFLPSAYFLVYNMTANRTTYLWLNFPLK